MTAPLDLADITADGVTKVFGAKRSQRIVAVDQVSISIDATMMLGIVGESGSGKSTLARLMVGLDPTSSGGIYFNGNDVGSFGRGDWRRFRQAVQLVAQDTSSSFDPRRTLRDAVQLPARKLCGLSRTLADERVERTLALLSLPGQLADRRPHEVSGGQRQRFALARALVVEPRVLVCDEVVSALDVSVQGTILNLLKDHCTQQRAGLVFVSHGLAATAFIADQLAVMHRGRMVEVGPTRQVLHAPAHPYTASLLAAHAGRAASDTDASVGLADPARADWACRYAGLCPRATEVCRDQRPLLQDVEGRKVACHHPVEPPDLVLTGTSTGVRVEVGGVRA